MMTMKLTLALLVVGALLPLACATPAFDSTEVREVSVTMTDELRFEPDALTVAAGESVRLAVWLAASQSVLERDINGSRAACRT